MTEDFLNKLSVDELVDLLIQTTEEIHILIEAPDGLDRTKYEAKTKEAKLIYRIINAKKAE